MTRELAHNSMMAESDKRVRSCEGIGLMVLMVLASLVFGVWTAESAYGQVGGTGRIVGVVEDPSGAVMPDAVVTVTNRATKAQVNITSDSKGGFIISNLPVGEYHLQTTKQGFQAFAAVTVIVGRDTNITLRLADGRCCEFSDSYPKELFVV
jgi:hypothetical protein